MQLGYGQELGLQGIIKSVNAQKVWVTPEQG